MSEHLLNPWMDASGIFILPLVACHCPYRYRIALNLYPVLTCPAWSI